MAMSMYPRLLPILCAISRLAVHAAVHVERNDGRVEIVEDEGSITPTVDGDLGQEPIFGGLLGPRDLFSRQSCSAPGQNIICADGCCPNDQWCCENTNCLDASSSICCQGGIQCYKGGDCCTNGKCCDPGNYCVRDLDTGKTGCRAYSGSSDSSGTDEEETLTSTYAISTTTTFPSTASFSCDDPDYRPCPDQRYCCPAGTYCYYNEANEGSCYDSLYYTLYYYYSWSFSYGIRWYTTTTTYYLLESSSVPVIATPSPTAPPDITTNTIPAPTGGDSNPDPSSAPDGADSSPSAGALPGGVVDTESGGSSSARLASATSSSLFSGESDVAGSGSGSGGLSSAHHSYSSLLVGTAAWLMPCVWAWAWAVLLS